MVQFPPHDKVVNELVGLGHQHPYMPPAIKGPPPITCFTGTSHWPDTDVYARTSLADPPQSTPDGRSPGAGPA